MSYRTENPKNMWVNHIDEKNAKRYPAGGIKYNKLLFLAITPDLTRFAIQFLVNAELKKKTTNAYFSTTMMMNLLSP